MSCFILLMIPIMHGTLNHVQPRSKLKVFIDFPVLCECVRTVDHATLTTALIYCTDVSVSKWCIIDLFWCGFVDFFSSLVEIIIYLNEEDAVCWSGGKALCDFYDFGLYTADKTDVTWNQWHLVLFTVVCLFENDTKLHYPGSHLPALLISLCLPPVLLCVLVTHNEHRNRLRYCVCIHSCECGLASVT